MRSFFIALTRSPIGLFGAAVTTASAVLIITLFLIEMFGHHGSPYVGILAYLILPGIFLMGLVLIPVGVIRERRLSLKAGRSGARKPTFPVVDLNVDRTRRWVLIFVGLTSVNVIILALATYKGVEVMDSTEFCGTTCHSVMEPEFTAYQRSAHSRVKCVSCHIGPGAGWFVKSKLSGAGQLLAVSFDTYPRPIPTPVHNLRPARETCEQCHWPTKFIGDLLKTITHHENDEANTPLKTVLLLRVGGLSGSGSEGIHWHVDPDHQVRYRSDETRESIYEVELTDADGAVKTYRRPDADESAPPESGQWRVMDCVDCHNRPSHVFRLPEDEVDLALVDGTISRSLPFIRRESIRALRGEYATKEEATQQIASTINAFYAENYPEIATSQRALLDQAELTLAEIYGSNVFPKMGLDWGTYPVHIGHTVSDGCFRCHDEELATEDGETISQDCFTCHALLAMDEEQPEILETFDQ
jgi:nitrate/TMAO reductase-like tetraheme cytochrome c subunit